MPLYAYVCPECGTEREGFNRVSERHTSAPVCHGPMGIQLQPNIGYVQRECHFICPVTKQEITTNRQRARVMAEHSLIDANDFKPAQRIPQAEREYQKREELASKLGPQKHMARQFAAISPE